MKLHSEGVSGALLCVPFVPKDAAEDLWSAYFTVSESIFREFNPKSRLPDRKMARRRMSVTSPSYLINRIIIRNAENTPVAVASIAYETELSPSYELDKNICQISVGVDKRFRRNHIAAGVVKELLFTAERMQKDIVTAEVDNPVGRKFCESLNGEMVHEEVLHRLYMEEADWEIVAEWRGKGKKKFPDTTFEFFQKCSDADIDMFCRTYTEIINERPTGDMQQIIITTSESRRIEEQNMEKKGIEWYTLISREKNGDISGMTDIMYHPREPHKIVQYFTGVSARHRRKGLAKRLKAEMLYNITDKFPDVEYITTTMAPNNRPMQAINAQMGFKSRKKDLTYQWSLTDLKVRVEERLQTTRKRRKRGCQTDYPS